MMFKKCVTIIVAVLFCAITMHAQEQLNLNLVGETRSYLAMLPLGDDEFLVSYAVQEENQIALGRMKTDGTELSYVVQSQVFAEQGYTNIEQTILFEEKENLAGIIYHKVRGDSLWIAVGDISDDLVITEKGSVLLSDNRRNFIEPEYVIEDEQTFAVSYFTGETMNNQFRIMRINKRGDVLADRIFTSRIFDLDRLFALNADSTGYLIGGGDINEQPLRHRCYNLDFNLDTIMLHEEIFGGFPYQGWHIPLLFPYIAKHPNSGKLYVVGFSGGWQDVNTGHAINQDAIIAEFDSNMSHIEHWDYAMNTNSPDQRAYWKSIDFLPDGSVVMCALINQNHEGFYVAHFDENLNKLSEVYCHDNGESISPVEICAMPNGSCLVSALSQRLYHIPADSFWNIDEAHAHGLSLAIAYPNPGGNEMHIRTAAENAAVEVYDMNGRLVAQQPVTETETVLDATDWAAGTYVWKVISAGKDVESGKWVKE